VPPGGGRKGLRSGGSPGAPYGLGWRSSEVMPSLPPAGAARRGG
jgi:hypothetical protein